jgi:hypothetical protein
LGYELRLFAPIVQRDKRWLHCFRVARRAQVFFELFDVGCNRTIGDFENLGHAAIIELDPERLRLRITVRKFEDVLEIRAAPGVDRLRIIADHHHVLMFAGE